MTFNFISNGYHLDHTFNRSTNVGKSTDLGVTHLLEHSWMIIYIHIYIYMTTVVGS